MRIRFISSIAVLASVCVNPQYASAQTWSHDPSSATGPNFWGSVAPQYATCGTTTSGGQFQAVGAKQTPIDIKDATALMAVLPDVSFHYSATPLEVENTG